MENDQHSQEIPGIDAGKASDESVIRVHARIRRTPVAASPVVFFTAMALLVVLIFTWGYVRRYTSEWDSKSVLADREQIAALGKSLEGPVIVEAIVYDGAKVYAQQCSACHQLSGQGLAGAFPPLAGSEWVQGDKALPIRIVLKGLSGEVTVKGQAFNGLMPGLGGLKDAEIAAVLTYVRSSWDNGADEVLEEDVAAVRAEIADQTALWTADDLKEFF